MKCFVCSKEVRHSYLCKEHADLLYEMLNNSIGKIVKPDWKYHCLICGEYKDRTIIEFPNSGYFCDKDIVAAYEKYNS